MGDSWTVTQMEPYQKAKYKIYLNDEFAFVLYKGEVRKLNMVVGDILTKEQYSAIINEILNKRAIKRAMYLLKSMERTEYQLREKLRANFYPEESVDAAIAYVSSYRYVDDAGYAVRYMDAGSSRKSRRQMEQELAGKGISREYIDRAIEETECDDRKLIREIIAKKSRNMDIQEPKQRQKVIRHLLYKGFAWEDVRYEMEHLT